MKSLNLRTGVGGPAILRSAPPVVSHTDLAPCANAGLAGAHADTIEGREGRPDVAAE